MNLNKTLNAVGKAVFVKYYYVFMNMPTNDCMEMFTEDYTEKSKKNRVYHAKMIFRKGKQYDALKIIFTSQKVNQKTRNKAIQIYSKENKKRRYAIL